MREEKSYATGKDKFIYLVLRESGGGEGRGRGEIIRSSWWTSDIVHNSTKKLPFI